MTIATNGIGSCFPSNFQANIAIEEGQDYTLRPLRLQDDVDLAEFLVHFYDQEYEHPLAFEELAQTISELVWRGLENDPLGCYLIRDANEKLVGHFTFDPSKRGSSIFISSEMKRHFWQITTHLWNWTKNVFVKMDLANHRIRKIPIRNTCFCVRVSSQDLLRTKLLEMEGFSKNIPSDEPPNNTLYQFHLSTLKNSILYQMPVKTLISSPDRDPAETFFAWNELSKIYPLFKKAHPPN